ncbi:hypothetical protein HK099_006749 [Clydaea vesicula]|uniref:N-acetylgalactosaminide beta-1,3-galactosyltransferase n=1 Tax=Clydaea vesicula TaxID=447962 RepID=A0AAD5U9I1_9FUNG|nr:hypothetical protein HK099_006749 [Clydaea vesicula]
MQRIFLNVAIIFIITSTLLLFLYPKGNYRENLDSVLDLKFAAKKFPDEQKTMNSKNKAAILEQKIYKLIKENANYELSEEKKDKLRNSNAVQIEKTDSTELEEFEALDKIFLMKEKQVEEVIKEEDVKEVEEQFMDSTIGQEEAVSKEKSEIYETTLITETDVLFVVLTKEEEQETRIPAILETYGSNNNSNFYFFSRSELKIRSDLENFIILPDLYPLKLHTQKKLFWDALKYTYEKVQPDVKAKWVIVVTDKTFVNIKGVLDFINFKEKNGISWFSPHILGKCLATTLNGSKLIYTDGGTGNILSSKLLDVLNENGYYEENKDFLQKSDEYHLNTEASLGLFLKDIFGDKTFSKYLAKNSVHSCGFQENELFHKKCYHSKVFNMKASSLKCKDIDCASFSNCNSEEMNFWFNYYQQKYAYAK